MAATYTYNLTAIPANDVCIGSLPGHIRQLTTDIQGHLNQEHSDISSGSDGGCGSHHLQGSANAFFLAAVSIPTNLPGNSGRAMVTDATTDDGRLWIDSDNTTLFVREKDNATGIGSGNNFWSAVTVAGMNTTTAEGTGATLIGDQVCLLVGRVGDQNLYGGTASAESLYLHGSFHADGGPVELGAKCTDFIGNTTDGTDGAQFKKLMTASETYDALSKGVAVIDLADVATDGQICLTAHGYVASMTTDKTYTLDCGFAPDFIVAYNSGSASPMAFWHSSNNNARKRATGGFEDGTSDIGVSGNVITIGDALINNGKELFVIAYHFNQTVVAMTEV